MQQFIEKKFENTDNNIVGVRSTVEKLTDTVEKNFGKLAALEKTAEIQKKEINALMGVVGEKDRARRNDIERIEAAVEELRKGSPFDITEKVRSEVAKEVLLSRDAQRTDESLSNRCNNSEKYWIARRSIRCWPVPGSTVQDIWRGTDIFLRHTMDIPNDTILETDILEVRRIKPGSRRARIQDEVLVRFKDISTRDFVTSYAKNLGKCVDDRGFPTAGIRLDIPDFLVGVHQDLQRYGSHLRKIHGQGLKRHVRFNDPDLSLHLDVRLPGTEEWLRVGWELAKEERATLDRASTATTRDRLASSASSNGDNEEPMITEERRNPLPTSDTLRKYSRAPSSWGSTR